MGDEAAAAQRPSLIKKMVEWSNIARKQGLLGLEPVLERETIRSCARRCSWWWMAASPRASAA